MIFYKDSEIEEITEKRINVQSMIEKPSIYLFANTFDSIAEKLSYVEERLEDLAEMAEPIITGNGITLNDTMRFLQGILTLIDKVKY